LRFESPQQRTSFRVVSAPLQVGDFRLEPGQQIGVIIGAANRDGAEFPNADVFDIRRNPNRHLAFGVGIHNCQGKILARAQARIALAAMIRGLPTLELAQDEPAWRKNSFVRAVGRLPVRVR
jgi:pimeloyl-[acyl-carrier protein] synthase